MVMKQRGGTKAKSCRGCWKFFNLHFLHQEWSKYLELALAKLRGLCKYLANACNSNSHVYGLHCLTFVYQNKAGKSTQWGESSFNKSSALSHMKCGEVSLQIEFATLPPKTTTSLWKRNEKGIGIIRKMRSQANSTQCNTQRWNMKGGVWSEETAGGGGGGGRRLLKNLKSGWVKWSAETNHLELCK